MLSTDWKYGGWPASGEIDIMEHVGYDPGVIHGTIHTEKYNYIKQTQKEGKTSVADAQDTFHVYAIDWREDKIDFFVDDNPAMTSPGGLSISAFFLSSTLPWVETGAAARGLTIPSGPSAWRLTTCGYTRESFLIAATPPPCAQFEGRYPTPAYC
jgi:hypothetical protein